MENIKYTNQQISKKIWNKEQVHVNFCMACYNELNGELLWTKE